MGEAGGGLEKGLNQGMSCGRIPSGRLDEDDEDLQLQVSENSWAAQQAKRHEHIRGTNEARRDRTGDGG